MKTATPPFFAQLPFRGWCAAAVRWRMLLQHYASCEDNATGLKQRQQPPSGCRAALPSSPRLGRVRSPAISCRIDCAAENSLRCWGVCDLGAPATRSVQASNYNAPQEVLPPAGAAPLIGLLVLGRDSLKGIWLHKVKHKGALGAIQTFAGMRSKLVRFRFGSLGTR